jgi:phage shock protein PspC (stress-responsive transcriptional regulator)
MEDIMTKRLYRSRQNKMIAGVAGGLGEYFEVDPVIVRAIFILLIFGWGMSILAYFILWIIVPLEDPVCDRKVTEEDQLEGSFVDEVHYPKKRNDKRLLAGIVLIGIGLYLFIGNFVDWADFHKLWPLIIIAIGIIILLKSYKNSNNKKELV